ncbi:SDR family oxidoreductase [Pseudohalioglobus lutimaris]|uniref:Short chain dehydrogenase n=1 Tax=Pseudohalioglobus lutimaris TaxID=1737061 RepID=A0A2N5X392_9GAMM|nr:SDR family oxidoreductase [Pseudohalioglobus lutimaris]PLW68962.1 short chain dehydrogenase [Pseudohalioglobus lutimaris]
MDISGKRVVLTGAAGGIGSAMARKLAGRGACLLLVGRTIDQLGALCEALPGDGHRPVVADITAEEGRATVVNACADAVDILINNAGVNCFGLLEHQTDEQLQEMIAVNVMAPILLTRDLLPQLRQRHGAVVNVGSGFGSIGFAGYCGYSASKFALRGFTEALRRELADSDVRVQYLAPRAVATPMNPPEVVAMNEELGNATDAPEQVAEELLALLHSGKSVRQIGAPERFFAMLNALLPGIVDSALVKKLAVVRRQAMAAHTVAR